MFKKRISKVLIAISLLILVSISNISVLPSVIANGDGPPAPEVLFEGHNFDENYWDIMVFNNSNWDNPFVNNETCWLNNTWNIKWIKEGNFEMGMAAFMNKTKCKTEKR